MLNVELQQNVNEPKRWESHTHSTVSDFLRMNIDNRKILQTFWNYQPPSWNRGDNTQSLKHTNQHVLSLAPRRTTEHQPGTVDTIQYSIKSVESLRMGSDRIKRGLKHSLPFELTQTQLLNSFLSQLVRMCIVVRLFALRTSTLRFRPQKGTRNTVFWKLNTKI